MMGAVIGVFVGAAVAVTSIYVYVVRLFGKEWHK